MTRLLNNYDSDASVIQNEVLNFAEDKVLNMFYSAKLTPVELRNDPNILKIGVSPSLLEGMDRNQPLLLTMDRNQPLSCFIQEVCSQWTLQNPSDYALKDEKADYYITEKNRNQLVQGSVLALAVSPARASEQLLVNLRNGEEQELSLQKLAKSAADHTFALEFTSQAGLDLVKEKIQAGTLLGSMLSNLLQSFLLLMEHSQTSWDALDPPLIERVFSFVVVKKESKLETNRVAFTPAMQILDAIAMNSTKPQLNFAKVEYVEALTAHFEAKDVCPDTATSVQLNALVLVNTLFAKAVGEQKKKIAAVLNSRAVRTSLASNLLKTRSQSVDVRHQLYVLQTLLLNVHDERRMTRCNVESQEFDKVLELRRIAFRETNEPTSPRTMRKNGGDPKQRVDFKRLGFKSFNTPLDDFGVPPGALALDCLTFFAKHHRDAFIRIVLENSCRSDNRDCPFAYTAILLTKMLAEVLNIGEQPADDCQVFYPMLLSQENALMELFVVCVKLLNKTWKEMRATADDVDKTMSVVREQIVRSLAAMPETFERFQEELNRHSYAEIQRVRQQEHEQREESEFQAPPIKELRLSLEPEMVRLVETNRLSWLCEGKLFAKYAAGSRSAREKGKFWYWKLSPNQKVFHYADSDEKAVAHNLDDLKQILPVSEIQAIVVGRECPHMKDAKVKKSIATHSLAFSLLLANPDMTYNFVAPDGETFAMWTDAIRVLLGQKMESRDAERDLDMLLNMEVRIRLLDAAGIEIPNGAPEIPPVPTDFDFSAEVA